MIPAEILGAGFALVVSVTVGTIAHELSHAVALRAFGVPFELEWFPDRAGSGLLRAGISGGWASVTPDGIPRELPPWNLRAAALMPLLLATPLALVLLGVLPDPFEAGNASVSAAAIGWFACALPSPQDFSLVWHAERAIAERVRDRGPRDEAP